METIRLDEVGIEAAVQGAAEVLRAGGVILYPTDTLYGLGADALSDNAVSKIKRIKGRDEKKPIHCVMEDLKAAEEYAVLNTAAEMLARTFWPGPLTLILKKKPEISSGIARGMDTFGVRVPHHAFCHVLAREFGAPYTTTSANKSGEDSPRTVDAILDQLGNTKEEIDLVIDAGELPERQPSTVVDISHERAVILREGAIPAADIWDVLKPSP
ncbi:threonylcarbamoyl-AMP synthase [Candidatus Parcubacteria bacterium]|nr:MAG: threonylcarbamoyl-AMP synthase [Candidatus Parcubacteria bacterium]